MSRRDLMRYYLLRTNAENKCDTVLTARHAALMRRVCCFTTSELSTLFNKSMQSVSNMKQRINTNLFGKETSDLLEENLMNL